MEKWREKLPDFAFFAFCIALLVTGIVQVATGAGHLLHNHVDTPPASSSTIIPSLGFYSATIPSSAQEMITDWFSRQNISTDAGNFSVHSNTYNEKLYTIEQSEFRDITFIADIKNPKVSYHIYTQVAFNPLTSDDSETMTYITCPDESQQFGDKNNCHGMDQL